MAWALALVQVPAQTVLESFDQRRHRRRGGAGHATSRLRSYCHCRRGRCLRPDKRAVTALTWGTSDSGA